MLFYAQFIYGKSLSIHDVENYTYFNDKKK